MKSIELNYYIPSKKSEIQIDEDKILSLNYPSSMYLIDEVFYSYWKDKININDSPFVLFKSAEESKTLKYLEDIVIKMKEHNLNRHSTLVVIGGGSLLDLGGLTANLFHRGMNLVLVPTTLLAMVDAAIGGKTAANIIHKNQIGTYYPAQTIIIKPSYLSTLPKKELKSGMIELIKNIVLKPTVDWEETKKYSHVFLQEKIPPLNLLQASILSKTIIVQEDPLENNYRLVLNLGHTFGHALESYWNHSVPHGICVGLGILVSLFVSSKMFGKKKFFTELEQLILSILPKRGDFSFPYFPTLKLFLNADKKLDGQFLQFILLKDFGDPIIQPINFKEIETYYKEFLIQYELCKN